MKITFLSQFPPPMHGLSKAVETLYNSHLCEKYHFSKIDITNNRHFLITLWRLLKDRSDVIYFTPSQTRGGNLRDLLLLFIIWLKRKPCIAHIHGGYFRKLIDNDCPRWQREMNYRAVKRLAGGIVLGHSLRNIFEGLLPEDRIFVCPNCVDDEFVVPSIDGKLSDIRERKPLHILYLSNFIVSKGYRTVLKLARMAVENGDKDRFVFHFAGAFFSDDERQYFDSHSKGLDNIVFHGTVSGKAKLDLLLQCHLFTLLTCYPNEGQPISILEAMAGGMAIITTNHAGIPEIATNENGFICDKHNIDATAVYGYLKECDSDRTALAGTCRNNYLIAKEKYTERQYISNMDKIFEAVCKE